MTHPTVPPILPKPEQPSKWKVGRQGSVVVLTTPGGRTFLLARQAKALAAMLVDVAEKIEPQAAFPAREPDADGRRG